MSYRYRANTELPAIPIQWRDADGNPVDFSTGWTFTVYICEPSSAVALVTKTTGITGAATFPNVTIDWSVTDFSALTAAATGINYDVHLIARRTGDTKDDWLGPITITLYTTITT